MKNPVNLLSSQMWKARKGVWEQHIGSAQFTYDFATDGGAIGLITPQNSPVIPANAIIIGGVTDVITAVTSGGAATISLGTSAGSSAASLKAAVILGTEFAVGLRAIIPVFTAATMFKMTASGQITMTVASFALTAGKFNTTVIYLLSE